MAVKDIIGFKPNARLILQLGDQLIRSESIAILELIKNSYDACANKVIVRAKNMDNPRLGEIVIEDDGYGMDLTTVRDVWLHPGTTFKKKLVNDKKYQSPCNRLPIGEKGIGRFGVHKLGNEIELISSADGKKEVRLKIDWKDFDNDQLLDQVPVDLTERTPELFVGRTGTKLIIRDLKSKWTRGTVREMYRAITSLNSPFDTIDSFKVDFKTDKSEWLNGLLKFKDVVDHALFEAKATIKGNKLDLDYYFTPWTTMKELNKRHHSEKGIEMVHQVYDEEKKKKVKKDIDLADYKIGEVKLKLLIYDLDSTILSLGVEDKKGLKDYLKSNGGVRVYREGIRVYDYGEPGNDWLNLDIERVNLPTARISNNIIIGAVQLDRLASSDLEEKTNREGFIENDAYREFLSAVRFTIARVVTQRNIDKDKIRNYYGRSKVPITDSLRQLREKIEKNVESEKERKEITSIIDEIWDDYKTITEVYIRSASAGLSLSIVIHEIEKIIAELMKVVEASSSSERIRSLTKHLGKLIDGYSGVIRKRSRKEHSAVQVINDSLGNIEFRLRAHEIIIVDHYRKIKDFNILIKCAESLIIGTIVNIIDNSIWWLTYGKVQLKKIFIDISDEMPGYTTILIADNGPGFTLPAEEVIKPFISNKEGGIGIGLHLANEIMNSHGGELLFPTPDQFTVPKDFRSGAIIGLAFKNTAGGA